MKKILSFNRVLSMRSRPHIHDTVRLLRSWDRTSIVHALIILTVTVGLAATDVAFGTSWETTSLRAPGGGLVRVGMTRQEVLNELGQQAGTQATTRNKAGDKKSGRKGGALTYRGDDGLYTITFSGEKVARIVVTPKRD